ncbi:winged helix-turn-helix domain-containing protein [Halosegnis longus]|uniref:winged helix-turn-helix domain-containing protein n=1 Tax=Halosegnis longus TaxID=2216012 RepID=UPI00129E8987
MGAANNGQKVTDGELLQAVKDHPDPVVSNTELSENIPLTSTRVNQRLARMESQGLVKSKRLGSGKAWWVPSCPD